MYYLLNSLGLHNVINKASWVTSSSQTFIDTIFTNSTSVKVASYNISDHLPIFCISDIYFKRTQYKREKKSQ